MHREHKVYVEFDEVGARLKALGLDRELLLEAARRGLAAFAACTAHHPRNFPALASWAETSRALCDLLVVHEYRWLKVEDNGQPQVHNPPGSISLTVAGGDGNTGRRGGPEPKTSASKGYTTSRAMIQNGYLFPDMEADALKRLEASAGRQTWFLLIHRDKSVGEMRCELSMPISMSDDRKVNGWQERIILPTTSFDSTLFESIPDEPEGFTEEVQIDLKRRA